MEKVRVNFVGNLDDVRDSFVAAQFGSGDLINLLNKWKEIFQRKDFFQDMKMVPINRRIEGDDGEYVSDPNNSEEYDRIPGFWGIDYPKWEEGWLCELKDGGLLCVYIRDYLTKDEEGWTNSVGVEYDLGILDLYSEEKEGGAIFRRYYLYYKPNKNSDEWLIFSLTDGNCLRFYSGEPVHSVYEDWLQELSDKGYYSSPASMALMHGVGENPPSMFSFIPILWFDDFNDNPTMRKELGYIGWPFGFIRETEQYFDYLAKSKFIGDFDVKAFYHHLVEFLKPVSQEIKLQNCIEFSKTMARNALQEEED